MPEDVAPRIREGMEDIITQNNADRRSLTRIRVKAEQGTATFEDANEYARLRGNGVRKAIENIAVSDLPNGQMYYNIAVRTVGDALDEMVVDVLDIAESATKAANEAAGIGLNPIRPDMSDNVHSLVDKCTEELWETVKHEISAAAQTLSHKAVDDTIESNARFQSEAGLDPKIIRKVTIRACKWCRDMAGTHEYHPNAEYFRRHANCDCEIIFDPGKGGKRELVSNRTYRQNLDSLTPEERERRAEERAESSFEIYKSVGAEARNYDILDPSTGEYFHFIPGTRINNVETFAGYGTRDSLKEEVVEGLSEEFHVTKDLWKHCKGTGHIDVYGSDELAEVHWFQHKDIGKVKFRIKKWLS